MHLCLKLWGIRFDNIGIIFGAFPHHGRTGSYIKFSTVWWYGEMKEDVNKRRWKKNKFQFLFLFGHLKFHFPSRSATYPIVRGEFGRGALHPMPKKRSFRCRNGSYSCSSSRQEKQFQDLEAALQFWREFSELIVEGSIN